MQLLPEGTLRRKWFEAADRGLCRLLTGSTLTCSTYIGNKVKSGEALPRHYLAAALIDICTLELHHVWKNAGKP